MKKLLPIAILIFAFNSSLTYSQTTLLFCFDNAGNQITKSTCYQDCLVSEFCIPSGRYSQNTNKTENELQNNDNEETTISEFKDMITLFPNPTTGEVKLSWHEDLQDKIFSIEIVGMSNLFYKNLNFISEIGSLETNITKEITGMYIFKVTLKDGNIIYKKVLKQ